MPLPDNFFVGLLYGPSGPITHRLGDSTWGKYLDEAFDGKDNENFLEKSRILCKYTFGFANMFAIIDIVMFYHKGGVAVTLQRLKWHYIPWVGGALAYASAVNVCSSLRGGKTDQYNHLVGGLATGAVIGKHSRSGMVGFVSGAIFAVLGSFYKDCRMRGFSVVRNFDKDGPGKHGTPFHYKSDFTTNLIKDKPAYWAKSEADIPRVVQQGQLGDGTGTLRRLW